MYNLFVKKEQTLYEVLKRETRPIVVYGMGNGADKIFDICENKGIKITDIFASDEFVRGHSFRDIRVKTYGEICELYGDFVILLAFAVFKDDLMDKIENMASEHTLLVPDVPLFGGGLFDYDFLTVNMDNIKKAYNLFADDKSREVFVDIINFRLTGDPKILRRCETDRAEVFSSIIKLGDNEAYVDLGAYDGDTIKEFLDNTNNKYSVITAFEPDKKNMKKLHRAFGDLENCRLLPYASWECDCEMNFSGSGGRMSCFDESGYKVLARSVDSVCDRADYIKMDVEGAEYETLMGCREIIKRFRPSLAVSAYHRVGDIFTLPILIDSLNHGYKIYLRHHKYLPSWESNLYVIYN
ncbi:MAG: FkbM family methyltransferase [Clostridia bacterium]|nr:FkbM family methyltransferase [Clostridia bacterium]